MIAFLTACTSGGFYKTEHFAEYGSHGSANYYRVRMSASGHNGKVDYRSGWYDAQAVDRLFGNVSTQHSIEAVTANRRKEALRKTFDQYMGALEDPTKPADDVEAARKRYMQAMNGVSGTSSLDEGKSSPLDHADEKFVMILSSDPDAIIEAIKGHVQQRQLKESLRRILGGEVERKDAIDRLRLDVLIAQLGGATATIESTIQSLATPGNDARLRLRALAAELEAVR